MKKPTLRRPSFGLVLGTIAVSMVVSGGTAYAAKQITGGQIKNNTVLSADIKNENLKAIDIAPNAITSSELKDGAVTSTDILDATITSTDILDGTIVTDDVADESLTGTDILDNSIASADVAPLDGDADIIDNSITTFDIATDAVDSDEVLDFGLTNQDIGVLFAQVASDGATVDNSSGGVTSQALGTGTRGVDFGRDISSCAFIVTQGEAGVGGAGGAITGATDRSSNANAVFVTTRDAAGTLINTAFQIVVVC